MYFSHINPQFFINLLETRYYDKNKIIFITFQNVKKIVENFHKIFMNITLFAYETGKTN